MALLAWATVAGIAIPFVLVTEPYNDTLQFYQAGLYVFWIFTAVAMAGIAARNSALGAAVIVLGMVSLPSSLHYLERRWTDNQRPPLVGITRTEDSHGGSYLRAQDPDTTVVLNDRPLDPSLLAVLSERRVVLAWGRYAVGSGERIARSGGFLRIYACSAELARHSPQAPRHPRGDSHRARQGEP